MENYKEVWIGRKHWGAILFPVIAFLVFAIELYIKILMNRSNYTPDDVFGKPLFDRGFTGHEHLTAFGLVNMNGRMYEPVMSSFLSPDRYVPYDRYRLAAVV